MSTASGFDDSGEEFSQLARDVQPDDGHLHLEGTLEPRRSQVHFESTEVEENYFTDPETARIFAETERHVEDNRLLAFKESLASQDTESQREYHYQDIQNERNHQFRMEQLRHSAQEKKVVLYCSVAALIVGGAISLRGSPSLGNPIMSAAMTILITLVTGKLKVGE